MHICYLIHREYPQNNATAINEYPRILSNLGVDVTVIAAKTKPAQPDHETIDGIDVHRIPTDKSTSKSVEPTVFGYRGLKKLDQLSRIVSIDVLHMLAFPNLGFILHPLPWLDSPPGVVIDIRGAATSSWFLNRLSRVVLNAQAALAETVVTIDPLMAEYVLGDSAAADILPLGADFDRFRPGDGSDVRQSLGVSPEDVLFGYTGTLSQSRDLDRMIDAFALARETHPQAKLVLVGDGDDRTRLEQHVVRSGCADAILFTGEIPFLEMPRYVRAFNVGFAYIPDRRPFRIQPPLKTIEFLASGLPTLATDTPGNRRFVRHNENGLLCSDSKLEYRTAIQELIESPAKRERLGANARDSVREYDYTRIVEECLLPLYKRVVSKNTSARHHQ